MCFCIEIYLHRNNFTYSQYRLGFSNPVATVAPIKSPAEQPVLVLFVLGGITYKEIGQVRTVLQLAAASNNTKNSRVVLIATDIVNNETIIHDVFAI